MKEQDLSATASPPAAPTAPPAPANLSRTEQCFYELLSDGKPHSIPELTQYVWDKLSINLRVVVAAWITRLRVKLPKGYHIVPVKENGFLHYQLVRDL